jgi:DNA adenine methylase
MQAIKSQSGPEAAPFVKWAGGKTRLLPKLDVLIPPFARYFEPFLGGGALFFHLALRLQFGAHLSDANRELVNAYNMVKHDVEGLISVLERHERNYRNSPAGYYYRLRSARPDDDLESAARFIALNKTCYNGLYRVNRNGEFNVPIGRYRNPIICDKSQLRSASGALKYSDANIFACDYKKALRKTREGDFVYLDPPFNPLSATAHFVDYTRNGFGQRDQIELAQVFRELDRKGCMVLLSNSDTGLTRELYSEFDQSAVQVLRAISCKGSARTGYYELLVRNYSL